MRAAFTFGAKKCIILMITECSLLFYLELIEMISFKTLKNNI